MPSYKKSMQSTSEPRGTEVSQQAYSVCVYHNGYYLMNSNVYSSPEEAEVFMDYCKNMDHSKLEYQMYTHTSTGRMMTPSTSTSKSKSTTFKTDEVDLSGMTLEKYGKGFLLRPYENCEFYGLKYFLNGFWMKKHESWFFKTEYYDDLIMYGAEYISDSLVEDYASSQDEYYVEEEEVEEVEEDDLEYTSSEELYDYNNQLKGLMFLEYGRGYIVYPEKTHEMYGEKYMGNGWWNSKAKGWFFKKECYDELIEAGAKYTTEEEEDIELVQTPEVLIVEELELGKMGKWQKYKGGFLFKPKKTHPQYEQKTYNGGWWMPTQKAWFFRKSVGSKLVPKSLL